MTALFDSGVCAGVADGCGSWLRAHDTDTTPQPKATTTDVNVIQRPNISPHIL
jgi:hypothetical protein